MRFVVGEVFGYLRELVSRTVESAGKFTLVVSIVDALLFAAVTLIPRFPNEIRGVIQAASLWTLLVWLVLLLVVVIPSRMWAEVQRIRVEPVVPTTFVTTINMPGSFPGGTQIIGSEEVTNVTNTTGPADSGSDNTISGG
jgi:hypothetical protein